MRFCKKCGRSEETGCLLIGSGMILYCTGSVITIFASEEKSKKNKPSEDN